MAGAIAELARRSVSHDFRSITPHCSRVLLVEAGEPCSPELPAEAVDRRRASLRKLGVESRLGAPVDGYRRRLCPARPGADPRLTRSSGPPASRPRPRRSGCAPSATATAAFSSERIFACRPRRTSSRSAIRPASPDLTGVPLPGRRTRRQATGPLCRRPASSGAAPRPFRYRDFGNLATIGRNSAVIDWGSLQLSGFVAWLIWSRRPHLVPDRLPQPPHRSASAGSGTTSPYQRSARLITGEIRFVPSPTRAPSPSKGNVHEVPHTGSGRARPDRARPPGRRRARRLSSRCL